MKLEFESIAEILYFLKELGYSIDKEINTKPICTEQKEINNDKISISYNCPYFVNGKCTKWDYGYPFYPITINQPYLNTDVGAAKNTEWQTSTGSNGSETITINMKDFDKNFNNNSHSDIDKS